MKSLLFFLILLVLIAVLMTNLLGEDANRSDSMKIEKATSVAAPEDIHVWLYHTNFSTRFYCMQVSEQRFVVIITNGAIEVIPLPKKGDE